MKRLILIAGFTVLVVASAAIACVEPCNGASCDHYEYWATTASKSRLPISRDGVARVRYLVNPSGNPAVTNADLIGATKAAAATWERATRGLEMIYAGTTTVPALPYLDDDVFVVGWGPSTGGPWTARSAGGTPDIVLTGTPRWGWYPCGTAETGRCGMTRARPMAETVPGSSLTGRYRDLDLQDELTHLFGNALGLSGLYRQDWFEGMTMNAYDPHGGCPRGMVCRDRSTLARGDILGIRALYPSRCPAPSARTRASSSSICGVAVVTP